jgi:hypothetical protein
MGKVFRTGIILVIILLSFYNLSFGDQAASGTSPSNVWNGLIYGQRLYFQKGEALPSSPGKAESGASFLGARPSKANGNRESSLNPEVTDIKQSSATGEIPKEERSHSGNNQLWKGKPGYPFGKIHFRRSNLEPFFDCTSSLSVVQYKEENHLSQALEKFKEADILKALAIVFELKLSF